MHQVVRVTRDVPEQGVSKGMVGAVVAIFDGPVRACQVEFVDSEGRTVLEAILTEEDQEVLSNGVVGPVPGPPTGEVSG